MTITSNSRDYEISYSTIQLELNSIILNEFNTNQRNCKCLLAIQPFSILTSIDLLLGSSQLDQNNIKNKSKNQVEVDGIQLENDHAKSSHNRVKNVQLIIGMNTPQMQSQTISDWSLNYITNILHIPLPSSQSSSKQFHIVIWYELMNTNIISSLSSSNVNLSSASTPILLLDQLNMLNWFPCVIEDKYPMDWIISIPSHCSVTKRKLVAICSGDLIGRYAHPEISGQILYKYSCKIPISPKSVVIVVGAFESVKLNARSLGFGADLFGGNADEVPDLLNASSSNSTSSRVKVFYQKEWDKDLVYSTCQYLPQTLEFVEQWVGASYPFPSLKIVFSGTSSVPIISGATLIIVNIQLLVSDKDLDHVWFSRFYLSSAIAHQWFGHYIAKQSVDDLWIIIGFSRCIAYQFMRRVYGNNEVKFRLKKDMERLCIVDVKQPPLCPVDLPKTHEDLLTGHDLNPFEDSSSIRAELINIKSALVFYMMEQRFGKGLLQKVASKIMMTHMSGELGSGLSTVLFLKLARKLSGKLEIKEFADQWIYRSGSPILSVRYTFNRKKMVIEVIIKQRSSNEGMVGANPKFTGPITIRVQEPAGTFDTEVRLEEYEKKYDIIYHTKYKRIRRSGKKIRKGAMGDDDEEDEEEEEDNGLNSMHQGDDAAELMAEPDRITFEWIRIDPDSLWVCHKSFEQEDFMWNSLLRQDKDIIAHYETVVALGKISSIPTCATILNILKDSNYFYRIRMEAAFALTKFDTEELEYVGLTHLTKYFRENFCMPSEKFIPQRNNFEDLQLYYLKCALILAIARFRDSKGWSPVIVRSMLIDLLRFNDNSGNKYSDSSWICLLLDLLGDSFLARPKNADDLSLCLNERVHYKAVKEIRKEDIEEFDFPIEADSFSHRNAETVKDHFGEEDHHLLDLAMEEVMKALKRDRFAASRNNCVTIACLELLIKWQIAGLTALNISIFLYYSRHGHFPAIRKIAIEALVLLSGLEEEDLTRYLAHLSVDDPDPYIRYSTSISMMHFIALACQQIQAAAHPEVAKMTLKKQLLVMIDVWHPITPERYDFHVYRYLAKIVQLTREVIPSAKEKLTFKLPNYSTSNVDGSITAASADDAVTESVVPAVHPILKPLKLSLKGMRASPAKPAVSLAGVTRKKMLERLMAQKHAFWFLEPVDPISSGLHNYHEIIKYPMDLGTIKKKLDTGKYANSLDFAADMRLVFSNAMYYNDNTTQAHVDALNLSIQFENEFGSKIADSASQSISEIPESIPEPTSVPDKAIASKPTPKPAVPSVNQIEGAQKVLTKLFDSNHSVIFRYPVDGEMYPEYYNIVKNPIDLQATKKRIATGGYHTFQDFHNDMNLLIANCFKFNRKGTFGFAAGTEFQNLYQRLLKPYVKLLDPATAKKVVPPNSVNPAAPLAKKVTTNVPNPEKPKVPTSFNVRVPGKTGITIRLPPRHPSKPISSSKLNPEISPIGPSPSITLKLSIPSSSATTASPNLNDQSFQGISRDSPSSATSQIYMHQPIKLKIKALKESAEPIKEVAKPAASINVSSEPKPTALINVPSEPKSAALIDIPSEPKPAPKLKLKFTLKR